MSRTITWTCKSCRREHALDSSYDAFIRFKIDDGETYGVFLGIRDEEEPRARIYCPGPWGFEFFSFTSVGLRIRNAEVLNPKEVLDLLNAPQMTEVRPGTTPAPPASVTPRGGDYALDVIAC